MFKQKPILVSIVLLVAAFGIALTAEGQTPKAQEIERAAKSIKLKPRDSTTAERNGMKVTVTPTDSAKSKTADFEKGVVIAVVDTVGVPDLPDARYNLFAVKSNGRWRAFLEANGRVTEFQNVKATETNAGERTIPLPELILAPKCSCGSICVGSGKNMACFNACQRCL